MGGTFNKRATKLGKDVGKRFTYGVFSRILIVPLRSDLVCSHGVFIYTHT